MTQKLKRDQLPPKKAENWKKSFEEEKQLTFNLDLTPIILQKETYKALIGENENRVRVYLGLEPEQKDGRYQLCAFAVSAFLLGSADVYADYETPVFKLGKENVNLSENTQEVINSIRLYRKWRAGELDSNAEGTAYRQYIYPNAYLLTKFELHELFNAQNHDEVKIEFGVTKTMNAMISAATSTTLKSTELEGDTTDEVYNETSPCPPFCDERSIYNS